MSVDRIKDRIRKLLSVASNDAAASGEIENAMRFAQALMAQHHIDEEDVHAAAGAEDRPREYDRGGSFTEGVRLTTWESNLTDIVGDLCGVKCYIESQSVKKKDGRIVFGSDGLSLKATKIVWYGEVGDVREAGEIYNEWQTTIAATARLKFGGALQGDGLYYCLGFVRSMRDANRPTADQAPEAKAIMLRGQSIVLARKNAASDWLKTQGVKLTSRGGGGGCGTGDGSAYGEGRKDGTGVSLSRRGRLPGGGGQLAIGGK